MPAPRLQSEGQILESLASVRAARAVQARGISLRVAAQEFGVTRTAVHHQLCRIKRIEGQIAVTPRLTLTLARRAARYAHDLPCTRDRAALIFGVDVKSVVAAWRLLFPNDRRMRVG